MAAPTSPPEPSAGFAAEVRRTRPELAGRFERELPGARAAVLARLLGGLRREPLPGLTGRCRGSRAGVERVSFTTATVEFPGYAGEAFAAAEVGLAAEVDGVAVTDPGELVDRLWPGAALAGEVRDSVVHLALARADTAGPPRDAAGDPGGPPRLLRDAAGDPDGPGRIEQAVVDGHPLHPCCRARGGMSVADVLAYAPEHRPVIRLRRLRVPAERWHGDTPPLLYAHPWQAARLRDEHPWLADAGETGPVRPLMSLRTVAPLDGGDHVKTAVDVQMTSAVRTVSPAAVHNGPILSALLRKLTAGLPLTVLAETAAGAVIVEGAPQRRLAYLRREAPRTGPDETVAPLAAMAMPALLAEAVDDPYRWFTDLATLLWPALLAVLDRGVALEAHGQNTLVVLRAGRPVRILYRDLGGVRVSATRLRAAGLEAPALLGDLPSDDPAVLRTKLAAAALGTVAAELVTALSAHRGADPRRLWGIVAAAVRSAGTADARAMLRDPLPVKATTAMRLAADPIDDIWTAVDNPMAGDT